MQPRAVLDLLVGAVTKLEIFVPGEFLLAASMPEY
jgi:hypothetical protein